MSESFNKFTELLFYVMCYKVNNLSNLGTTLNSYVGKTAFSAGILIINSVIFVNIAKHLTVAMFPKNIFDAHLEISNQK